MLIESRLCSRARFWASLHQDDQLSELESALLEAHLAGCPSCRSFTSASTRTTEELRAAPLAAHAPVVVRAVRRRPAPLMVALTAAVIAGAAVAGGLVRNVLAPASESAPAPHPVAVVAANTFELNDHARRLWSASLAHRPGARDVSV